MTTTTPRKKPFEVDDLYLHLHITDMHCTPHGQRAACVVRSVDRADDSYVSKLWSFALDGSAPAVQLTQPPGSDSAPRWSPDGQRLAFISDRGGSAQVHLLARAGGDARALGSLPGEPANPRWSPDGRRLLVTAAVPVDPDLRGARPGQHQSKRQGLAQSGSASKRAGGNDSGDGKDAEDNNNVQGAKTCQPEVAWRLPYKADGVGYLLRREIHLFALDAHTGAHTQLTDGAFDVQAHDIAADGQRIAYVRTREGRFAHRTDLWVCHADGTGHRQLTDSYAMVMQPAWSPDGRSIAFSGAVLEGDAESRLWLLDVATGRVQQLGDVEVGLPESLHWAQDGQSLLFVRAHCGKHQVARIALDGTLTVVLDGDHQIGVFGCTGAHFALSVHQPSLPSELHTCPAGEGDCGGTLRQVSDLNPWWKERLPVTAETMRFTVPDPHGGTEEIEGWLLRAEGSKGSMPLVDDIHGGPASYALLDFDTNVYWQVLCSRGWAVLALNAVGSASYGRDFCHKLEGHWATYDLPQHIAAVQQLQRDGVCDDRVAVCGKSYGGYLSAWAVGHTNIFKAAVVMAPVGNIETHYGTSDGGYYADPFYMATAPRFDRERARTLSPLQFIEQSKTPTLFMQGFNDERCPKCQSEELFVSMMRAGDTPAEMVLYPNENHGFLGEGAPSCRADAARRIIAWVTQHCGSGDDGDGDDSSANKETASALQARESA